jgi:two-component system, chemotaxis family, sensor kinase CheA
MDDFRKQFLSDAIEKLDTLIAELEIIKSISGSSKIELLRCLHTIKGSAQVFGLNQPSVLAHQLENLVLSPPNLIGVVPQLQQGLLVLKNSLTKTETDESQKFVNAIDASGPQDVFSDIIAVANDVTVPVSITSKLSSQEKIALKNESRSGNTVFCVEIRFNGPAFAGQLTTARGILDDSGIVVAAIPCSDFGLNGIFGFNFLFTSSKQTRDIEKIVDKLCGKITYCSSESQNSPQEIVSLAVSHGTELAKNLGKSIEFDVLTDEKEIPSAKLKLIFESLLHLVRNAVDHAFDQSGTLRIRVDSFTDGISIAVTDDGKGIDLGQIRAIAKEKSSVADIENLSDEATLALIFQSEFSTASKITEISGRGVGLDVVRSSIENAGGTISVKSKQNEGTSFEIFLPNMVSSANRQ